MRSGSGLMTRTLGSGLGAFVNRRLLVILHLMFFALLLLFVVWPVGSLVIKSFQAKGTGQFTLQHYVEFFSKSYYRRALTNSLVLALSTTSITIVLGFMVAFTACRGPRWMRRPLRVVILMPLVAPPVIFGISLIILLGRRGLVTNLLGLQGWDIYGWSGVILAQVLTFLPLAVLLMENVLIAMNPNLEETARDLGASEWTALRTIIVPLSAPGVVKAALMVFSLSLADFANPVLLGARMSFLATDSWAFITGENDFHMASVDSVFLIIPTIILFIAHHYGLKGRGYTTISGRPVATEEQAMGALLRILFVTMSVVAALTILLCFAIVPLGAVTQLVGIDNTLTLKHLTSNVGLTGLVVSLKVALVAGVLAAGLGILLAYVLHRGSQRGRGMVEFLTLCGFALPGTVLGIGYLIAFNKPPLYITGTMAILILSMLFRFFAVAVEAGLSRLHQIPGEIEEASASLGASVLGTLWRIALLLMLSAFIAGFTYAFMNSMNTVSAAIFLISPAHQLASVYIFHMADRGSLGTACGIALEMILIVFVVLAVFHRIVRRTMPGYTGLMGAR